MYSRKQIEDIAATCYEQAQKELVSRDPTISRCTGCSYSNSNPDSICNKIIRISSCNPDWLHASNDHSSYDYGWCKVECLIDPLLDVIKAVKEAEDEDIKKNS